ncbi:M14 family metallopeptidase [soil metagenome]
MNKKVILSFFFCFLIFPFVCFSQQQFRKSFTTTPTYEDIIAIYTDILSGSKIGKLSVCGTTDSGKPLHLVVISKDGKFDPESPSGKTKIFINNGIHPGEPDGVDACIELTKTFLKFPDLLPDNIVLCIIPIYNIGGCLNRDSVSRVNQNGPDEYGFRGNSKNLDLNRDFIKCDAANTISLEKIIRKWNPDIFIDTHVSDGADYQYVMTLIETQRSKMNPIVSDFMDKEMVPALYAAMKKTRYEMCPYVESYNETPDDGIVSFMETPRFSTGYTSLFNCISFVTETHMWKQYNQRVWATYDFIFSVINYCKQHSAEIIEVHKEANENVSVQKIFSLNWQLDTTSFDWISFNGFEAKHKLSAITGLPRLYYDRNSPYTKKIKYFNTYFPSTTVTAPEYYLIPQAYAEVIDRLKLNDVVLKRLKKDTLMNVEVSRIEDYKTGKSPYESHYLHSNVKISKSMELIQFYQGDYVIETNQSSNRYIVETLEPEGDDSFFAWNFFDGILQQKEWFSDYIFEEKAESILKTNPDLKTALLEKQKTDSAFSNDHWAQLNFIYSHSPYMEKTYKRYPVCRLNEPAKLPVE